MSAVNEAVFGLILVFEALFVFTGLFLFIKRRKVFPIFGREISMVVCSNFLIFCFISFECIRAIMYGDVHCALELVFVFNVAFFAVNMMAIRTWRVWFLYFASREKLMAEQRIAAKQEVTDDMFWFTDRRRFVKTGFLWKVVLVVSTLEVIAADLMFYYQTTLDSFEPYDPRCESMEMVNVLTLVMSALVVIFALWTSYKTRKLDDGFFLKREFRILGFTAVGFLLMYVIFTAVDPKIEFRIGVFMQWLWMQPVLYSGTWYPIYKSYSTQRPARRRNKSSGSATRTASNSPSLIDILTKPQFNEALSHFTEHLINEFSVENVLFFQKVLEFEEMCTADVSDEELGIRAAEVYLQFMSQDCPAQVNLDYSVVKAVTVTLNECIENIHDIVKMGSNFRNGGQTVNRHFHPPVIKARVPDDIFETAKAAIYKLMKNDSYSRWKLLPEAKAVVHTIAI